MFKTTRCCGITFNNLCKQQKEKYFSAKTLANPTFSAIYFKKINCAQAVQNAAETKNQASFFEFAGHNW